MSNLSDIGFPVRTEADVNDIITNVLGSVSEIPCEIGFYLKFSDASGAELYLQGNFDQELIGFNPHFRGKSRREVNLTAAIERDSSPLDGSFYAWANPLPDNPESGEYPFVFDVPDFRVVEDENFPRRAAIQLAAFASNDFRIFASEQDFYDSQGTDEPKFAAKSFIPSGLFNFDENAENAQPPLPIGVFTGEIKEFEIKTNKLTGENFYWFLVETLGGETDVVADPKLITEEPKTGGYVTGQFWLSGKIEK